MVSADIRDGDVACDVRARDAVAVAVGEAVDRLGGLDTLVLNAGRPVVGPLHDLSPSDWDDGVATNLTSIHACVQSAWPHLNASGRATITATASIVGVIGSPNQAAYCATKAAVVMLMKCLALDGARAGIRANAVCPGFTETPMLERFLAEQDDPEAVRRFAVGLHPVGRLGTPLDVADAFVYLASDESAFVSGTAFTVDGGLSAGIWAG